jgi:S-adenosylmethionine hydrolase
MARPLVAFLTDFGLRDHYVGAMKGVVLGICADAALVDVTHEIAPQDVLGGALQLAAAYRYFPAGTIFLVVVDPGVGSSRRGIAVEAGGYQFVAPDNGVLGVVADQCPPTQIVSLTDRRYARPTISRTFEGRDRFAPAAGWLATGLAVGALGQAVTSLVPLDLPAVRCSSTEIDGEVLHVDRFGNLITNIDADSLATLTEPLVVTLGGRSIAGLVGTYAEAPPDALCALVGSSDRLEVAVRGGSAADVVGAGRGARVHVRHCA